jgi:hypothetical protein
MKKNLRGKIREFVQSEEGKVGVKSPLTLGVTAGSLLLAQAVVGTPQAEAFRECWVDDDCDNANHACHEVDWPHTKGTCHE